MSSVVHRTARITLRPTPAQRERCFGLLRAAGDAWAWTLDTNRERGRQGLAWITDYPTWCRQLTRSHARFGELPRLAVEGVLRRYTTACAQTTHRRKQGQPARYPRRKRHLVPVRFRHGLFKVHHRRIRLALARDLGIIHPFAVAASHGEGLLVSGRAIRAENRLHLDDTKARAAKHARKQPARRGQAGSRRWRRLRRRQRQAELRHRRRVRQTHHRAAGQVIDFAIANQVGTLIVGDLTGICDRDAGRVQNLRLRQWRRTHLLHALTDKAELTRVTHRRAGQVPARRDRRRHRMDTRRRSCLAPGRPPPAVGVARQPAAAQAGARGVRTPAVEDQQPLPPNEANVA